MVIRELILNSVNKLKACGIENAVFEGNLIVRTVLSLAPIDMVLSSGDRVKSSKITIVEEMVERRCKKEPLEYILGVQEFMGLEFLVNDKVLIPRADTETLVDAVLTKKGGISLLDLCTGTGCVGLSIAHYNKGAYVSAIDISEDALEIAQKNSEKLRLSDRVKFTKMDILTEIPQGVYDVITSNPPYIVHNVIDTLQDEVRLHEPRLALDGGEDGLKFYRRITDIAPKLLQEKGMLYFEVGYDQAEAVKDMMNESFKDIGVKKDLCGVERVVFGTRK